MVDALSSGKAPAASSERTRNDISPLRFDNCSLSIAALRSRFSAAGTSALKLLTTERPSSDVARSSTTNFPLTVTSTSTSTSRLGEEASTSRSKAMSRLRKSLVPGRSPSSFLHHIRMPSQRSARKPVTPCDGSKKANPSPLASARPGDAGRRVSMSPPPAG